MDYICTDSSVDSSSCFTCRLRTDKHIITDDTDQATNASTIYSMADKLAQTKNSDEENGHKQNYN